MVRAVLVAAALLTACAQEEEQAPVPAAEYARPQAADYATGRQSRQAPEVRFTDITAAAGIDFLHENGAVGDKWMPETMGSGGALFDYDGDGWLDLFLVNGRNWRLADGEKSSTSALYRNLGDGHFADVSVASGLALSVYGMGVTVADYDADGDPDLYVTTLGPNLLLENREGVFHERAVAAGVAGNTWRDERGGEHPEWSTAAMWVDMDADGWLDLVVTNYVRWSPATDIYTSLDGKTKSYATPQQYPGSTCRAYLNRGDGSFAEVTEAAGMLLPHAKSMGIAAGDFDRDGAVDIVITNDTQPNFLLHNLGDGRFEEIGLAAGIGYDDGGRARAGMGVDTASLANDGLEAIGIGNFSREAMSLYRQEGQVFLDVAGRSRLVQATLPTLTFGLRFFDYDLDGFQDLILVNGHIEPEINEVQKEIQYAQRPQLFWNDGSGRMLDVSAKTGGLFDRPLVARGLALGDIDRDGDEDVLVTTNGGPVHLLRNDGPTGRSLALKLRGRAPNLDALGTRVTAVAGEKRQEATVRTGSSYLSHSSTVLRFGLGGSDRADTLAIRWSDGSRELLTDLAAGAIYTIVQGEGIGGREEFRR